MSLQSANHDTEVEIHILNKYSITVSAFGIPTRSSLVYTFVLRSDSRWSREMTFGCSRIETFRLNTLMIGNFPLAIE